MLRFPSENLGDIKRKRGKGKQKERENSDKFPRNATAMSTNLYCICYAEEFYLLNYDFLVFQKDALWKRRRVEGFFRKI